MGPAVHRALAQVPEPGAADELRDGGVTEARVSRAQPVRMRQTTVRDGTEGLCRALHGPGRLQAADAAQVQEVRLGQDAHK